MGSMKVKIGVDVGGTNTDAVALAGKTVVGAAKAVTSADVTTGIVEAIQAVFQDVQTRGIGPLETERVHIGTTHFINALIQRRHLDRVSVIRLCMPATACLPPFTDFPQELKQHILGSIHLASGGYNFDGQTEISQLNESEIQNIINDIKANGVKNVVVSGVFSPVNINHENKVGELLKQHYPECTFTLSHEVGHLGLLERENASIINEALKKLCTETVFAFKKSLADLGLHCPLYLTQNDGTLLSAAQVLAMPVRTFSSGPTNSMRGAAYLSGVSDAIVVDIGGTSTDIGVLMSSMPREAATQIKVGGVRTNFRMPDVLSIGLGGGSIVKQRQKVSVGPTSVGYKLSREALVFGGATTTATDIAVAKRLAVIGNVDRVDTLPKALVDGALDEIHRLLEENIDQMKTNEQNIDVILVGGGSILVDPSRQIHGVKKIHKPDFFEVANAVGAALSQVSGDVDLSINLHTTSREDAVEQAKFQAIRAAIDAGAVPDTVEIVDFADIPAAYQPNDATRLKVKAVGNLGGADQLVKLKEKPRIIYTKATTQVDVETSVGDQTNEENEIIATEPKIDPDSGMWELSEYDVHCIAIGSGILGCGGGGNPTIGKLRMLKALRSGKRIRIISLERLHKIMTDDQHVISVAFMGAPLVLIEKICSGKELEKVVKVFVHSLTNKSKGMDIRKEEDGTEFIENYGDVSDLDPQTLKTKLAAVYAAEIGGLNSMEPLSVGAELDIPVLDADGMGRAFPELQMFTPFIYGASGDNCVIADENGNAGLLLKSPSPKKVEDFFRNLCIKMGCAAGIALAPLKKDDMCTKLVPHTTSQSWRLGHAVLKARRTHTDPVQAIIEDQHGVLLATGKIVDVERKIVGGFNRGLLKLEAFGKGTARERLTIFFQNENLVAKKEFHDQPDEVLVSTPDLICVVILETGEPVPTEELRYGLRVAVIAIPAPPILKTKQALAIVGPQAFGYPEDEVIYMPLDGYKPTTPIPPM